MNDSQRPPRRYYSERQGRGPKAQPMPFETIRRLVINVLDNLREKEYFQEAFGYWCVDAGDVNGTLGSDPDAYFLRTIMRDGVWPYWEPDTGETFPFVPYDERGPKWECW